MQGATGYSVATDKNDNVLECGKFDNSTIAFGLNVLTNKGGGPGYDDAFIAKYDPNGNILWAKSAGGIRDDGAASIATDGGSNAIICGWFISPVIVFGSDTLLNPNYAEDLFIAKYDAYGNVLWARSPGGNLATNSSALGAGVTTDIKGNAYLLANYNCTTIVYGSDTLKATTANPNGCISFVKYNGSGNVVWAKNLLISGSATGSSITTDYFQNIYMSGILNDATTIFGKDTIVNSSSGNIFLAKCDSNGNLVWIKDSHMSALTAGETSVTDSSGNIYLAGTADAETISFDNDTVKVGYKNSYIFKFDTYGNVLWCKNTINAPGSGVGNISLNSNGGIYATGGYRLNTSIIFDSDTLWNTGQGMDMFLAKYNGNGNVIWVKGVSATSYGHFIASSAVASDNFGNAYVTGNQSGDTVAFDADTIKSIYSTVFLAKSGSGPTGINPITKSPNSIIVYPNPSNSHFTFELSSNIQATTIDIYNLMGQEISSYSINQSTLLYTINMGNNSSGLYIYRVINKNGESIQEGKLLLEN
jgi:hypothetical protein